MVNQLPPYPGDDLRKWALQMVDYLQSRERIEQESLPEITQLAHLRGSEKAVTPGLIAYDPVMQTISFSDGQRFTALQVMIAMVWKGAWEAGTYTINSVVTDEGYLVIANTETDAKPLQGGNVHPDWDVIFTNGAQP